MTASSRAVDPRTRRVLVRLTGPKANRRNGGGPRCGAVFTRAQLDACRARFDRKWSPCPLTGCWFWYGAHNKPGYGSFAVVATAADLRVVSAHRVAYEMEIGAIPPRMTLDHTCRNPACINPEHMDVVTIEENIRRAQEAHRALDGAR